MMASKVCRIHYRKLQRGQDGGFPAHTLSNRIDAALNAAAEDGSLIRSKVAHRVVGVPGQDGYQRALNNFALGQDYVFGTVCLFSPGQLQALLKLGQDGEQADLAAVLEAYEIAETAAPAGHEYLHGLTYWTAIGDHFYQIQHIALQSGAMEQYLTWLLRDRAAVIGGTQSVTLQSVFDRGQLGDEDINYIQVGGIVPETLRAEPPVEAPQVPERPPEAVEVEERERLGGGVLGFAKGRQILNDLYGEVRAQELIDGIPAEASLEVSVNIGYRARRKKFQKAFMGELAAGLRNLPDGEITVRGKGGVAKGADARLYVDMSVHRLSDTSSLLEPDHALGRMLEAHRRLLDDGKIIP